MADRRRKSIADYFNQSARKQPRSDESASTSNSGQNLSVSDEISSHPPLSVDNDDSNAPESDLSIFFALPPNESSGSTSANDSLFPQPAATSTNQTANLLDVGRVLQVYGPTATRAPDDLKLKLLKAPLRPSMNATFPQKDFGKSGKRSFNAKWFSKFQWLSYSVASDGCLCIPCYFFAIRSDRSKGAALVEALFSDWKHAVESFNTHQSTDYHKNAIESTQEFERSQVVGDVMHHVQTAADKQNEHILQCLPKIVTAIMFCGQQCIGLRGHRGESGPITQNKPDSNDGNFRNLMRLMKAVGDPRWVDSFETMPKYALYTSPQSQNEFVEAIGELITDSFINEVKQAGYYSVLADEVQDTTWTEQLSISLRYVDMKSIEIKERFIKFIDMKELTGQAIADKILETLQSLGLDLNKYVGTGMDGAANMAGKYRGAAAIIRAQLPKAIYIHCSNHVVNLSISKASQVAVVKQTLSVINEVTWFLKPRHDIVKHFIRLYLPNSRWESCITFCETRWVERHDCLIRFKELYQTIFSSLEVIGKKKPEAVGFCNTMETFEFAYALCLVSQISGLMLATSIQLQSPRLDLLACLDHIREISELIEIKKQSAYEQSRELTEEALALLKKIKKTPVTVEAEKTALSVFGLEEEEPEESDGIDFDSPESDDPMPELPKSARRGVHAHMPPADYYVSKVFLPYMTELQKQLQERFLMHRNTCGKLQTLIPDTIGSFDDLKAALDLYETEISSVDTLKSQFELWKLRFQKTAKKPSTAIDALHENFTFLPDIKVLLQIFATLPVSTCTPERSNSTLKQLKTYLRNTMAQDRMNALALMYIYRSLDIKAEDVVTHWYRKKNRRL